LRALLFALLAVAFAHPYLPRTLLAVSRSGEVTILAIDNSLSMRAAGLLEKAKTLAKSEVADLHPGQRAQVLAFASRVEVLSEVTGDRTALDAAIDALEPSDGRTSFAELSRSLGSIAQSLHLPLRVLLYSDMPADRHACQFQRPAPERRYPAGARSAGLAANAQFCRRKRGRATPRLQRREDARAGHHRWFRYRQGVRNASLVLNGRVIQSKSVTVPESGRAAVEFNSLEVPYGRNQGAVKIDSADALAADDTFYFSVERADPRHALFIHDASNTRDLLYFKTALEASGQSAFAIDPAVADQTANVALSQYAFVVISDVGLTAGVIRKRACGSTYETAAPC